MKNIFKAMCLMMVAGVMFASCSDDKYTITVNANDPTMGITMGSGEYAKGETVQIAAQANIGYYFIQWNDGNTQNPRTITVEGDAVYTANFSNTQPGGGQGGGDNPGGGGGEYPTPGDFTASFTVDGTTYTGIALISMGYADNAQGILGLTILAGENGPYFNANILPRVGTQTGADGGQCNFFLTQDDVATTSQGQVPHYISIDAAGGSMNVNVTAIDLTAQTITATISGMFVDMTTIETAATPTLVPYSATMDGAWQTASYPGK